ncbi:MAG: DUF3325 domain-containing protein [Pseudomonadota bacterium]
MTLLALSCAYAGFACLALAMDRHHRQLWQRPVGQGRRAMLRLAGATLLTTSLVACSAAAGWSTGLVLWFCVLTASGLAFVVLLPLAPRLALAGTLAVIPSGIAAALMTMPRP